MFTGAAGITVAGLNFGDCSHSITTSIHGVSCQTSSWTSETTIFCSTQQFPQFKILQSSVTFALTLAAVVGTARSLLFTIDGPLASSYVEAKQTVICCCFCSTQHLGCNCEFGHLRECCCHCSRPELWPPVLLCLGAAGEQHLLHDSLVYIDIGFMQQRQRRPSLAGGRAYSRHKCRNTCKRIFLRR